MATTGTDTEQHINRLVKGSHRGGIITIRDGGGCSALNADTLAHLIKQTNTDVTGVEVYLNEHLGEQGVKILAELAKVKNSITTLAFHRVVLKSEQADRGAAYLADALAGNKTLTTLVYSDNGATDEGAAHLAKLLTENKTLRRVDFTGNNFTDAGVKEITTALEQNPELSNNLISFGMDTYKMDKFVVARYAKALMAAGNKNLIKITEDEDSIVPGLDKFVEANLEKARSLAHIIEHGTLVSNDNFQAVKERLPAIFEVMCDDAGRVMRGVSPEEGKALYDKELSRCAKSLASVQREAMRHGVEFELPTEIFAYTSAGKMERMRETGARMGTGISRRL